MTWEGGFSLSSSRKCVIYYLKEGKQKAFSRIGIVFPPLRQHYLPNAYMITYIPNTATQREKLFSHILAFVDLKRASLSPCLSHFELSVPTG